MSNELLEATIIKTGAKIQVYRLKSGGFCNYADCNTRYKKEELRFTKHHKE